jgi:hypothetical protein
MSHVRSSYFFSAITHANAQQNMFLQGTYTQLFACADRVGSSYNSHVSDLANAALFCQRLGVLLAMRSFSQPQQISSLRWQLEWSFPCDVSVTIP